MQTLTERNKEVVTRFNKEFIEQGIMTSFSELVSMDMVNHAAPQGMSMGAEGMLQSIRGVLKKGFPDLRVELLSLIAEDDFVAARKIFHGTHLGVYMGIPATGRNIQIHSWEIIRIKDGQYAERWGISDVQEIIRQLTI